MRVLIFQKNVSVVLNVSGRVKTMQLNPFRNLIRQAMKQESVKENI